MYNLIAFDAYGTLTRLITISDPSPTGSQYYLSFWEITARALRYSCKRLDLPPTHVCSECINRNITKDRLKNIFYILYKY